MSMRTGNLIRRKLGVERLERRDMLAGFSATLDAQGVLRITGTEAANSMTLVSNGSRIYIQGQTQQFTLSQVRQITIEGLGGNDTIRLDSQSVAGMQALNISATINGGAGDDTIVGGQGNDIVFGGLGNDTIYGMLGNDYLDGGLGNDYIFGGAGVDTLAGDKGNDILTGDAGADMLFGGDGSDKLYGGAGSDSLDGGRDFDYLYGEADFDYLYDLGTNTITDATGRVSLSSIGWFDTNVTDDVLRSIARSLYQDGSFNRADMLAIYGVVARDGSVSATELASLRAMSGTGTGLQMAEFVQNLAFKVANSNAANNLYQGTALGNLAAGSTSAQLNKLVNKWFYGSDRPNATINGTTYTYAYAQGSLFVGGAALNDVHQGYLGDCYLLAGLGEAALKTPSVIQQMFIDNGDGTFTVRFFNNGKADYVTVDRFLPVNSSGRLVLNNAGKLASSVANELWVSLAEKAYAQLNASGWLRGAGGTNSFSSIAGGYIADAFKQITGRATTLGNSITSMSTIAAAFNGGSLVGFASKGTGTVTAGVVRGHAYAMTGYNAATQTVTLFNPWGEGTSGSTPAYLTLTLAQLQQSFAYWDRTN